MSLSQPTPEVGGVSRSRRLKWVECNIAQPRLRPVPAGILRKQRERVYKNRELLAARSDPETVVEETE